MKGCRVEKYLQFIISDVREVKGRGVGLRSRGVTMTTPHGTALRPVGTSRNPFHPMNTLSHPNPTLSLNQANRCSHTTVSSSHALQREHTSATANYYGYFSKSPSAIERMFLEKKIHGVRKSSRFSLSPPLSCVCVCLLCLRHPPPPPRPLLSRRKADRQVSPQRRATTYLLYAQAPPLSANPTHFTRLHPPSRIPHMRAQIPGANDRGDSLAGVCV